MKWKPMGRAATASILSLATMLGVTSCSNDYTVAYVYMPTAKTLPHGLINAYQVDYQSGFLYTMPDSPIDAGGRNTVGLVTAVNTKDSTKRFLYSVNRDDSNVVEFSVGTDGKIYPENTYNITGSFATSAAVDAAGKFLFVTFTYQNGANGQQLYTPANPGPGGITVFPINADNTLGTPSTVPAGRNPIAIAVSPDSKYVYVLDQDSATTANLLGFQNTSGALAPMPGVTIASSNTASTGFNVGTSPIGILVDPTSSHVYVTDQVANTLSSFSIGSNGVPTLISTLNTGAAPQGMSFDLSNPAKYLYVVNYGANSVDGYSLSNGVPTKLSSASVATGTGPTCIAMIGSPSSAAPTHAAYMFISNALSNNVTALQQNTSTGALEQVQGQPFGGSTLPSCIATISALPLR